MASGPLVGGGAGGDGSREKQRWGESKVYTRKSYKKPQSQPKPPVSSQQTLATTTDDINSSLQQPPSPQQKQQQPPLFSRFDSAPSDDDASSLNNRGPHQDAADAASDPVPPNNHSSHYHRSGSNQNNGHHRPLSSQKLENGGDSHIVISLSSGSKHEFREIRSKLEEELEQVRAIIKKVEARELELVSSSGHAPVATGYSHSQLSASDTHHHMTATKRPGTNYEAASAAPLRHQLSVSVATLQAENVSMNESMEKEKRTPKANQYYRNSEFLLGKDKFPPPDSQKKSKANGGKKHMMAEADYGMPLLGKMHAQAFKSCGSLLAKLMKHKHGWVFNTPVDVKGLGLHDYYTIIKHPMDLGTVKSRLNKNKYRSPLEFAEDVRLTFRNAMTYNPKGQDVHVMAEQLSNLFEDHWPTIEAENNALSYPGITRKAPPPLDMRRVLERSESTTHPVVPDSIPRAVSYTHTPHVGRTPAPKKPKAKDPYKRDMTFEEKQKLSYNLQSLPSEKLDNIVQIIKKRNLSLSQHDDEIEVDIESVDTETLWELDRFVTNYKKSLSKNKRKAELAVLARKEAEHNVQERNSQNPVPAAVELPKESKTVEDEKHVASSSPGERKGDNASRSSSSNSSSSDSGSSSSDSDSESSSAYGSDVGHSPRT